MKKTRKNRIKQKTFNKGTKKIKKYRKRSMKGGFLKIPFLGGGNSKEKILLNALCNDVSETDLDSAPKNVNVLVKSLCKTSQSAGSSGIISNAFSLVKGATKPFFNIIQNIATFGSSNDNIDVNKVLDEVKSSNIVSNTESKLVSNTISNNSLSNNSVSNNNVKVDNIKKSKDIDSNLIDTNNIIKKSIQTAGGKRRKKSKKRIKNKNNKNK